MYTMCLLMISTKLILESSDELDEELIGWVKNYNVESKPMVMELLNKYRDKDIFVFKRREDAEKYLLNFQNNKF